MVLQHRRPGFVELVLESRDNAWVVVPNVVHAVSGIEIKDNAPVCKIKLDSLAVHVLDVHLQDVEQSHPLRVDVTLVQSFSIILDAYGVQHGSPSR